MCATEMIERMVPANEAERQRLTGMLLLLSNAILIMGYQFTRPSFVSCFVDDSILHISWCAQFQQALAEGILLPRWLPLANGGYGSPVFIFYSPLVYYLTAIVALVAPLVTAMKIVKLLALFFSGVSMFWFATMVFGRRAGLATALIYQLLPYHVLDNYYWTFYAENTAWIWFPAILGGLWKCTQRPDEIRGYLVTTACYSGLILTHLVSAFMFVFVCLAFVLCMGWRTWSRWALKLALAALASLGLTAYFVGPLLYEQRFVHIDQIVKLVDYKNTFVFFPNAVAHQYYRFFLNIILLLQWVMGAQMVVLLAGGWSSKFNGEPGNQELRRLRIFFILLAASCAFLTTEASKWLWGVVPGFSQVQFPMRWLAFLTLAVSCVAGIGIRSLSEYSAHWRTKIKAVLLATTFFVCGLLSLVIVSNSCFLEEEANRLALLHAYNATEYNPLWTPEPEKRLRLQTEPLFYLEAGYGKVTVEKWASQEKILSYSAAGPLTLRLRVFDYPGWTAYVDGFPHSLQRDSLTGAIKVALSAGSHLLRIRFEDTWWRIGAQVISIVTLLLVVTTWLHYGRKARQFLPATMSALDEKELICTSLSNEMLERSGRLWMNLQTSLKWRRFLALFLISS